MEKIMKTIHALFFAITNVKDMEVVFNQQRQVRYIKVSSKIIYTKNNCLVYCIDNLFRNLADASAPEILKRLLPLTNS